MRICLKSREGDCRLTKTVQQPCLSEGPGRDRMSQSLSPSNIMTLSVAEDQSERNDAPDRFQDAPGRFQSTFIEILLAEGGRKGGQWKGVLKLF